MSRKLRLSSILFVLASAVAMMVLFIITCARRKKICWAFLPASIVEFIAGGYLFGLFQHEAHTAKRGAAYLDAEFGELEEAALTCKNEAAEEAQKLPLEDEKNDRLPDEALVGAEN